MNIITGYEGTPHITAAQDGALNAGIIGDGNYVLPVGSQLAATVITANQIAIADGVLVMNGRAASIEHGVSDYLTISNGSVGMKRIDLIVATYEMAGDSTESIKLEVIEGTPAASTPSPPSYTSGNILNGDIVAQTPLYQVNIDGVTIDSVDQLFTVSGSLEDFPGLYARLNGTGVSRVRFVSTTVGANGTKAITIPNSAQAVLFVNSLVSTNKGIFLVDANGTGTTHSVTVYAGTAMSASTATNKVTLSNTAAYSAYVTIMQTYGSTDITV